MRVITKLVWIAFVLPLVLWSCGPMDQPPIVQQTPPSLTSPSEGTTLTLLAEEADEELVFTTSVPDFGTTGSITYRLEMAPAGTNFESPIEIGTSETTDIFVEVGGLNSQLLSAGLEPEVPANIDLRVRASIDRSLRDLTGPSTTVVFVPFSDDVDLPQLRVPGDYQGWNPGNDNTIIFSEESNNVYEGFVHILSGSGEFKFITGPAWDDFPDYGGANGSLEEGGPNLSIPGDFGTHRVKADLTNLTYEIEWVGVWGIIGSATEGGWDNETPMSFNANENILTITTDLAEGEMKFRTHTWDNNYGLGDEPGVAGFDGGNIPIAEAGNYTITLDFKTPGVVRYSITQN